MSQGPLSPSPTRLGRRKTGQIEMYSEARFFTVTGWHVPGTPSPPLPPAWTPSPSSAPRLARPRLPSAHAPCQGPRCRAPISPALADAGLPSLPRCGQSKKCGEIPPPSGLGDLGDAATRAKVRQTSPCWRCSSSGRKTPPNLNASLPNQGSSGTSGGLRPDYRQRTIRAALMHATTFYEPRYHRHGDRPRSIPGWVPAVPGLVCPRARREVTSMKPSTPADYARQPPLHTTVGTDEIFRVRRWDLGSPAMPRCCDAHGPGLVGYPRCIRGP